MALDWLRLHQVARTVRTLLGLLHRLSTHRHLLFPLLRTNQHLYELPDSNWDFEQDRHYSYHYRPRYCHRDYLTYEILAVINSTIGSISRPSLSVLHGPFFLHSDRFLHFLITG